MQLKVLSLLALAGLAHSAAVFWPDGYNPTVEERAAAAASAERRELQLADRSPATSAPSLIQGRGLLHKCLQAHCGFESQIVPIEDVIQFTVWFGDGYIFNLAGGKPDIVDSSTTFQWNVHDFEGNSWAFRSTGWCRKFEALSNVGWVALHQIKWQHKEIECPPCGGKKDSCAKCQAAEAVFYWDYDDKEQCKKQGIVGNCDYAGKCTKETKGITMMCQPGTDSCTLYR